MYIWYTYHIIIIKNPANIILYLTLQVTILCFSFLFFFLLFSILFPSGLKYFTLYCLNTNYIVNSRLILHTPLSCAVSKISLNMTTAGLEWVLSDFCFIPYMKNLVFINVYSYEIYARYIT